VKTHRIKIPIEVYQLTCLVIIDKDISKKINSYSKREKWEFKIEEADHDLHGMAVNPGNFHTYYVFFSDQSLNPNIITHEVSHLVDYILEDKDVNDGEARAFLSGFINEKIFNYVFKKQLLQAHIAKR
jgi:hypothetical protein